MQRTAVASNVHRRARGERPKFGDVKLAVRDDWCRGAETLPCPLHDRPCSTRVGGPGRHHEAAGRTTARELDDDLGERLPGPPPERVARADVQDDELMERSDTGVAKDTPDARAGVCVRGHLHRVTRGVAGVDAEGRQQVPLLQHGVPRQQVIGTLHDMGVHPRVPGHAVANPHGRAARPGQPGAARTPMEIDRDIESLRAKPPRARQIVAPSRQSSSLGDHDHRVQVGVAVNHWCGQRLHDVGHVGVRIRPPQGAHQRRREHDVAN